MSRLAQQSLVTTLGYRITNDRSALTNKPQLRKDNSDPIKVYPEVSCVSSPRPCVRDRNFFKNLGHEHANAPNVCPWLDFGLPPRFPQVVWCHWREIGPFSAVQAQDGLIGRMWSARGKTSWNAQPRSRFERGSQGGQTVRRIGFPTELSWLTRWPIVGKLV